MSIIQAFLGNNKIILLDEATASLDTLSRRYVCKAIKDLRNGRTIIVTTHYMDEADYMGDVIGIMSQGKLVVEGSPIKLKNEFSEGYELTIIKVSLQFED